MSAPDELRQLADRLTKPEATRDDRRAAAVALRHHANLTAENARLRELCGYLIDACATHRIDVPIHSSLLDLVADIAGGAAAVSPPPAPTTCPTCGSTDRRVRERVAPVAAYSYPCPDSWHQAAT